MENIIEFKNVYKMYKLFKNDSERLINSVSNKHIHNKKIASNYLNFNVTRGERVSFLGANGAGKSTILKLITNVTYPTEGEIIVNGRVAALLELSAGFDLDFTGIENIYLKCQLLGLSKKETKMIEQNIINFADIGEYINMPVRTYSSGMKARLGFAIIIHSKADILVIDEAMAVGDKSFKKKCLNKIKEMTNKKDVTLIFVTHSLNQAKEFCERGIILNKGHIVYDDNIESTIKVYNRMSF